MALKDIKVFPEKRRGTHAIHLAMTTYPALTTMRTSSTAIIFLSLPFKADHQVSAEFKYISKVLGV